MYPAPRLGTRTSEEVHEMLLFLDDLHEAGLDLLGAPGQLRRLFGLNPAEARLVFTLWAQCYAARHGRELS